MTQSSPFFYEQFWVTRRDGVRQRYWYKIYEVEEIEYFRATYACNNVPISNFYHHFSVSQIDEVIDLDDLKEKLLYYMEMEIGYSRSEWWFEPVFGIEYPTPIEAFEPDLYFQHRVGRKS